MLFFPLLSFSQIKKVGLEVSLSGVSYKGDLDGGYNKFRNAVGLGFHIINEKRLNTHFLFQSGSVIAQSPTHPSKINGFKIERFVNTKFLTFQGDLQYKFLKKENTQVYFSQGFGIISFNLENNNEEDLIEKTSSRAEGETVNNLTIILPTSLGIRHYINDYIAISTDIGFYNTQTDYLDNISQLGSNAGNDNIFYFRLTGVIKLIKKEK